jgi:hypothetical protein
MISIHAVINKVTFRNIEFISDGGKNTVTNSFFSKHVKKATPHSTALSNYGYVTRRSERLNRHKGHGKTGVAVNNSNTIGTYKSHVIGRKNVTNFLF